MEKEELIKKLMSKEELLEVYNRLLSGLKPLLIHKDRLGVSNLPSEFSGEISDILYFEGTKSPALVLFVDALIQECETKSEDEILERFELVINMLKDLIQSIKKQKKYSKHQGQIIIAAKTATAPPRLLTV